MNNKVKQIGIPFILTLVFNLGIYYITGQNFGSGITPHTGVILVSGLIFGPYGAFGCAISNIFCDIIRGYNPIFSISTDIISFCISYLGYKLWYEKYKNRTEITKPKLNNTSDILLFLGIILVCGLIYALFIGNAYYLTYSQTSSMHHIIIIRYYLNFINSSFIFGIIGMWLSNRIDYTYIPKKSQKKLNKKLYQIIGFLLILTIILILIIDYSGVLNNTIIIFECIILFIILILYLKKPITADVATKNSKSIPEEMMNIFHLTTLIIITIGIIISYDSTLISALDDIIPLTKTEISISMMLLMDILLLIFFLPSLAVLRRVEIKVIEPILSFTKIENFIHENEKIKTDGLIKIYSKYINENNEIGTLARSYTDLINFNNHYIENIYEIESEKERIKTELDIATKIHASNLPTEAIKNDEYIIDGYSKPAKEVGGDFFDYYKIDDDNLAIIIGDASGKGVPAAILAIITQVMIKQLLKHEKNPSKVLYLLNNQLCENNSESMFITLWLGIYNKTTKKIIFSNAGHNPPLVKDNDEFKYLDINSGIVLGIMEDFDYINEEISFSKEIVLYTDGITDANNDNNEMYGEDRLLNFFNKFESDDDPIIPLLNNIHNFTQGEEQFDDMTILYLKDNHDKDSI